mgnify:CR=1 FL=1
MSIKKIITGLTLSLLLASGVAVAADSHSCYKLKLPSLTDEKHEAQ